MKRCNKCYEEKALTEFYSTPKTLDGKRGSCKTCFNSSIKKSRSDDPLTKLKDKARRERDSEKIKILAKNYRRNNKEFVSNLGKEWRQRNKSKLCEYTAKRRAIKLQAIPDWSDHKKIKLIFTKAKRLEVWLEVKIHVDHVVPLISDKVCGLHCEANFQILDASENLIKGNRHWPDMWEE